jgi:peptide/nickel transport system substrate-binding protein
MVFPVRSAWFRLSSALLSALLAACSRPPESVTIAVQTSVDTLDPHKKDALISIGVLGNVYEPLVFTDPGLSVRPVLAQRWENPDPSTWVFRLRPGVTFHDGRHLDAGDVVYSLERARTGDLEMKTYLVDVMAIRALDHSSVEVRTAQPDRIFLRRVAFVPIVARGASAESLEASPNGTGPYAVTEYRKDDTLGLRRHEQYHGARPAIRHVRFRFGIKPADAIAGLLSSELQLIQTDAKKLRAAVGSQDRFRILQTPSMSIQMLGYDLARDKTPYADAPSNPFRDPRVRQAIDLAIDRTRLVHSLSTDAVPASQLVPRLVFGHSPDIPPAAHDAPRARTLLAQAGYGAGFQVVLHARPFFQDAATSIRDQLREVGIGVELRFLGNSEYYTATQRRDLSLWIGSFACTGGDATELLNNLIHTTDATRKWGALNIGGYTNPGLDAAIEASAAIEDPVERRRALERVMRTVTEERPLLPLYTAQDGHGLERSFEWRPRADGFIRAAEITLAR